MTADAVGEAGLAAALDDFAAHATVLISLDFDGTLAPLQADPMASAPLPEAAAALDSLAGRPGVGLALVSGRILRDLHHLSHMPPGTWLIGSHGAERGRIAPDGSLALEPFELPADDVARLATMRARLEELATQAPGAWVEHKPVAEVLHTRPMADRSLAAATLTRAEAAGRDLGAIVITGHEVVELTAIQVSKGTALGRLRDEIEPGAVLYAGDDVTDEDALAVLGPGDVGIKVGPGTSRAEFRVADVQAMAATLTTLAARRAAIA